MDHLNGRIYDRRKDHIVLGTFESSAFILSLRNEDEFSSIHSFGYHSIPHIGTARFMTFSYNGRHCSTFTVVVPTYISLLPCEW